MVNAMIATLGANNENYVNNENNGKNADVMGNGNNDDNKGDDENDHKDDVFDDDDDEFSVVDESVLSSVHALSTTDDDKSQLSDSQKYTALPLETSTINLSKLLVLFVMYVSVTIIAVSTYLLSTKQAELEFQSQFEEYSIGVTKVSNLKAKDIFDAYYALSLAFTSSAIATNSSWPFVTIPLFEAMAGQVRERASAQFVSFLPFVSEENREEWNQYNVENQDWIHEGHRLAGLVPPPTNDDIIPFIHDKAEDSSPIQPGNDPPRSTYAPVWQTTPVTSASSIVNFDQYLQLKDVINQVSIADQAVISDVRNIDESDTAQEDDEAEKTSWPHSILAEPVYDSLLLGGDEQQQQQPSIVGIINAYIPWHVFFENILSDGIGAVILTVDNNCGQTFSFEIEGPDVEFLGFGEEFHDQQYEELVYSAHDNTSWKTQQGCGISLRFYPTEDFHNQYRSIKPVAYTVGIIVVFLITAVVFELYDCVVKKRQQRVMKSAARTHAIVSSFFPSYVRDQLIEYQHTGGKVDGRGGGGESLATSKRGFVTDTGKPIAEFHPHCTIMIADIVNFTAWSSVREPSQVFMLLETLYAAFDTIAKKRKVFKVETIGDAYVAVAGLPQARNDHAVVMARFAHSCMERMNEIVLDLETSLGPDTAELSSRFGLHSGPVTAGVLRGERARFQLFGDTINTASRMESTGIPNKVHLSQQTAHELKAAGKGHWLIRRDCKVVAKGKGELQTFWLEIKSSSGHVNTEKTESSLNSSSDEEKIHPIVLSGKEERLVSWHVDVLSRLLKQVVAMRPMEAISDENCNNSGANGFPDLINKPASSADLTVLDEVKEIIPLPNKKARYLQDPSSIELAPEVMNQLRRYVTTIASLYRKNSFHSFEHASHVAQSLTKLLSRVVAENTAVDYTNMSYKKATAETLHKFTYGIASDPLTQFACAFSALIHDVDHRGVPNTRLVQEEPDLANLYKKQSVAEQNSVDLSWELLMEEEFKDLRAVIYTNQDELDRFRQLVVNSVMATDIVDKELGALRKKRWNKAFHIETGDSTDGYSLDDEEEPEQEKINRKATIVIEHLIQAADVAHTMQHWHVYLKWNERFFHENYQAYLDGRLDKDPSIGWYQGEIGFFDFYIIPLAKKLESCGVFGVSSDECLDYATANRNEWEIKGKEIVEKYMLPYKKK